MKHTTRALFTVSALSALLCACGSEKAQKTEPKSGAAVEAPAPKAEAPAAPAATAAPATTAEPKTSAAAQAPADAQAQCAGHDGEACAASATGECPAPAAAPAATASAPVAQPSAAPAAPAAVAEKPAAAPTTAPEAAPADGPEVGQRMPAYKNTVHRPGAASSEGQAFDTHATTKPTLYIANSTTCPYCTVYIDRMKALETAYMAKGVDVVHVYPVREQTAEAKAAHHAAKGFQGGMIVDQDAAFAKALEIHKTPTAILTDANGKIVYRGRIDDNAQAAKVHVHELADAIDATLAGKAVQVATTEPFG